MDENGEDGVGEGAKTIQGYQHILTFSDGPRLCIGKNFALGNFKVSTSFRIQRTRVSCTSSASMEEFKRRSPIE